MEITLGQAVILGIVQGLTEFLPISSSGHLVLAAHLLGVRLPGVTFELVVHLGTLCAVLAVYGQDVLRIFTGCLLWVVGRRRPSEEVRFGALILVGTLPAALVGLFWKDSFERMFDSLSAVGTAWLVTAGLLLMAQWAMGRLENRPGKSPSLGSAIWVGIFQAAALFPGISRSGSTIAAGLMAGFHPSAAARFSFLLAIPAIVGASVLDLFNLDGREVLPFLPLLMGFFAAAVSGYVAIRILLRLLEGGKLWGFALYCLALGLLTLVFFAGGSVPSS